MTQHWTQSVHHDGSVKYVSNSNPALGESVTIRLRTGEKSPVKGIYLRTIPDGEQELIKMRPKECIPPVQWWEAEFTVHESSMNYRFIINADDGIWHYNAAGINNYEPLDHLDFRILANYPPVSWVQNAVFYQIFPDTFANSNPGDNPFPEPTEYMGHRLRLYPWGSPRPANAPYSQSFYGGNLTGIIQKLDYLTRLGVNALYLNPIFTSHSCHKYDTTDYENVDPFLGGNEALIALRKALDERHMRYILDIVPNHCGMQHPWFLKAQSDPSSPEFDFFTFTNHPDDYEHWGPYRNLVKLNYQSSELRRRMYERTDSVFQRWLKPPYSADGWRVDVGNMLGRQGVIQVNTEVIQGIRKAVKKASPESYLVGENFYDASAQLRGDQWDGVMNYNGLSLPLLNWLIGTKVGEEDFSEVIRTPVPFPTLALEAVWRTRMASTPWTIARQQFNLLTGHDTFRLRSMLNENDALHKLAVIIQFTFPGSPCIYYGDETGMADIPGLKPMNGVSRGCMIWDDTQWNHDLLRFYTSMIAFRRRSPVLQHGGFQMLTIEEHFFAYQREAPEGRILVLANRCPSPRLPGLLPVAHGGIADGTTFVERFSGEQAIVNDGLLPLPELSQGATVWEEK